MNSSLEYDKFLKEVALIKESPSRQDSKDYQEQLTKCLAHGLNLKTFIQTKSHLFSTNETLDDVSTRSLRFLSLDYYLAQMMVRKQVLTESPTQRNALRLKFLQKTIQLLAQFLVSLQDYSILQDSLSKKLDKFESVSEPKLEELYSSSKDDELKDATLKRQEKIELYRAGKDMETQIKFLENKLNDDKEDDNEEVLRELYLTQLKQLASESWNQLEQILMEMELLKNFGNSTIQDTPEREAPNSKDSEKDPTRYTEKLESLNKPLISKSGKVLRNFTLLNKKDQLKSQVFGYGQYGPTMTVEEFLEKEFEENKVLQGGPEVEEEANEDDNETNDLATYKARAWDDFTESNPKGSGNTMNRG
ncbi:unnamed protein product [Kluyveromyces dobzhanskii CBS 2104]|uniref:WGS project CCBQ000000000 data, contig 00015 n=1 Tax=Kluyveromyces dobzhanskii CBS 2104 TaxID=1427455 RepID=A0A0A8L8M6_9SACH|nr:unnamed protein product [Kluyveromyces dobzhanskii CBS 2104]